MQFQACFLYVYHSFLASVGAMLVSEQLRALLWYVRATLALSRAPRQPALSSRCTLIKSRCSDMLVLFWSFSLALSACSADQRVRSHAQCERMHTRAHTKKVGGFEHSAQGIPSKVMLARLVLALAFFSSGNCVFPPGWKLSWKLFRLLHHASSCLSHCCRLIPWPSSFQLQESSH